MSDINSEVSGFEIVGIQEVDWINIPEGEFLMGSPEHEAPRRNDYEKLHRVKVATFQMLATPVTFAMYDRFCVSTGRDKPEDEEWGRADRPVIFVDYWDAVDYCDWVSHQTGRLVRLPTEAEWEYACRAGTNTPFWTGNKITDKQANYNAKYHSEDNFGDNPHGSYREKTTPVKSFSPNPWGLYDMHGNVGEWCASAFGKDYKGAILAESWDNRDVHCNRVIRGGSWDVGAVFLRSAHRSNAEPAYKDWDIGFRLVREIVRLPCRNL